jgi:ubiquinone biosynthesis protein Coq4
VGEAALLAFSHHETRNLGVGMIATVAWFKLGRVTGREVGARRVIAGGRRRAKQAAWFVGVPWHDWLVRAVEDIRRELGVGRIVDYHEVRSHEVDVRLVA